MAEEAPALAPEHELYWFAFCDLLSDRPNDRNARIPWSAISRYADAYGVDVDELKRVVYRLDGQLREWWKANDGTGSTSQT